MIGEWSESYTVSSARSTESETRQSIDKIAKVIIRFNPDSAQQNWNRSGLNVIKSDLGEEFEIVSDERRSTLPNSLEISTTERETSSSLRMGNHVLEVDERDPDGKSTSNRILGIIHDKIVSHGVSANIHTKDLASSVESVSQPVSKEEGNRHATGKNIDSTKDTSRFTSSSVQGKPDDQVSMSDPLWRRKDEERFLRRVSASGAAMAIAMVVIGTIMLLLGPAVIVLRLLDERRRARKSQSELSDDSAWREDLPPTYEQVVLMNEEAPRYSTLVLSNRVDDYVHLSPCSLTLSPSRSPSPSPSPSPLPSTPFSPAYDSSSNLSVIKSHSCR